MSVTPQILRYVTFICCVLSLISCARGLIHDLSIKDDSRKHFFIENFGFESGGKMYMTITDWKVSGNPWTPASEEDAKKAAFLIKITDVDSTAFLEESSDYGCILAQEPDDDSLVVVIKNASRTDFSPPEITPDNEGFYNIYFVNCLDQPVSFHLRLEQYNIDYLGKKSYLSAGLSPIPTIYGIFSALYAVMLVVWIFAFIKGGGKRINRVHHLMTVLVILKGLSLMFQAVEQHFIKTTGSPHGWNVAYYIFTILKTIFFFVIIALIGTGWAFFKPFLSDKDKKIVMIVVPLQILDNIAMIIVDETAPGSQGWFTWKDIFRLVDIICCGAVLIPIIWSIKHLREASQIDGKAARNLQMLKLFRQFYLIVVSYIYFTRIIIYLLDAAVPFRMVYLGELFSELAALCFFSVIGYKFRPAEDNPYFKVQEDDDAVRMEEMTRSQEE